MKNLDDKKIMEKLDPSHVLDSIELFPEQCNQAWSESSVIRYADIYKQSKNIVVCGMGGSRFTPKSIKELYKDRISVPYEIIEDYTLPSYVDKETCVILSSYSGTTEEVYTCGSEAVKKGAKVTGLALGGKIIDFFKKNKLPYYQFDPKYNPCGQPRIGGGYMLFGHMGILHSLGFLTIDKSEIEQAVAWANTYGKLCNVRMQTDKNPAKQLAWSLIDTHPFIITSEFLRGFGNGFANQINETAKMISDYRHIPELNHHLMEGLKRPETLHQNGIFVFVTSPLYSSLIKKRYAITNDVVGKQHVKTITIELTGPTKLAQLLEGYTLSGFSTFYMAMIYDTDPVAIPWVDYFKSELAKT